MENPDALSNFFDLMLSVLRIVNAVVLSRGHQNDQTVKQARDFLLENRLSMVSVFKRYGRVGGLDVGGNGKIDLEELVEGFTLLISATGFLEVSLVLSLFES
jgi:nuclear pore complex protein Nup205